MDEEGSGDSRTRRRRELEDTTGASQWRFVSMDLKIIDGKKIASKKEEGIKQKLNSLKLRPIVVSILIGNDPASMFYTQIKQKKAQSLGIEFQPLIFPEETNFNQVVEAIIRSNLTPKICGIMVQLPIPKSFLKGRDKKELLNLIDPQKDIDGLTSHSPFLPAAVEAVLLILKEEKIEVKDKNIVIIGAGDLVGKPIAREISKLGAEVLVCDEHTKNLAQITQKADLLISAAGVPGLVNGEMVKEGTVVIDVGTTKLGEKIVGDIDFDSVSPKASRITPVPGGVGPLTVVSLMGNILKAAGY